MVHWQIAWWGEGIGWCSSLQDVVPWLGKLPPLGFGFHLAKWFFTIRNLPQRKRVQVILSCAHHTNMVSQKVVRVAWFGCVWLNQQVQRLPLQLEDVSVMTKYDQGIQVLCMLAWVLSGGNADYGTGLRDSFWTLGLGACQKGLWVYIQVVTFVRDVCHQKSEFLEVNESTDVVGVIH